MAVSISKSLTNKILSNQQPILTSQTQKIQDVASTSAVQDAIVSNLFTKDDGDQFKRDVSVSLPGKTTSMPSQEIAIVDLPEPGDFDVNFLYNFYVPDESINEISRYKTFNDKIEWPRQVDVTWTPCFVRDSISDDEFAQLKNQLFTGQTSIIEDNLKKILSEENFTSFRFVGVKYRDEDVIKKIDVHNVYSSNLLKPQVKKLVSNVVVQNDYSDSLNIGITKFIDYRAINAKRNNVKLNNNIENFQFDIQFNSKFIEDCMQMSVYDSFTTYDNDLINSVSSIIELGDALKTAHDSNSLNDNDFNTYIDYFSLEKVTSQKYVTGVRCLGYIVERYRNDIADKSFQKRFIINNPNVVSYIDKEIKYGSNYAYTISSVFLVRFLAVADDVEKTQYIINALVSSKKLTKTINCIETKPPSFPADFNIIWDYHLKCPSLSWTFPVERQRDVKYFQVFRRLSIESPFELIKQYSFNDIDSSFSLKETPNENVVEDIVESPKTYYVDEEFRDSKLKYAIYTVVCLDARGQTSAYSEQFGVSFDVSKNKMKKDLVVIAGSPKAYPNWFLNQDTFVDLVLDSGHKKIKFYVTPECTSYIKQNSKQDIFSVDKTVNQSSEFDKSGKYVLSIINLDLQQSENHTIKLIPR